MKLGVIGLGLIGGSIALDLKNCGFVEKIYGVDSFEENASTALKLNLIDEISTLENVCLSCDIILISTPVGIVEKLLPQILSKINSKQIVFDVGSTKAQICLSIDKHINRNCFVATHPMAGTEFSGPNAAHLGMFENKATVICDSENSNKEHLKIILDLYAALKMRVLFMNSAQHDLHVAYVSHLSHISSFVLANTVLDKEKDSTAIFNLASGGFESTVRLAKSSPEMWTPIFEQNQKNIIEALGDYIDRLKLFQESLIKHDFEQTKRYMYRSNDIKRVLSKIQNKN